MLRLIVALVACWGLAELPATADAGCSAASEFSTVCKVSDGTVTEASSADWSEGQSGSGEGHVSMSWGDAAIMPSADRCAVREMAAGCDSMIPAEGWNPLGSSLVGVPKPAPAAPPPPPNPRAIAQELVASLDLRAGTIGTFPLSTEADPKAVGYVGWNTWLWVNGLGDDTRTASRTVAGHTVSLTARATKVVWDMGNGDTLTCDEGTPWPEGSTHNEPSPTCNYVFERDGHYTITATTHWTINWQGIGQQGTIPLMLRDSVPYTVAEAQVLVTGSR